MQNPVKKLSRQEKDVGADLGQRLRAWRAEHDVSQAQLADMLGVTQPSISHWENNQPPEHTTMLILAMRALSMQYHPQTDRGESDGGGSSEEQARRGGTPL